MVASAATASTEFVLERRDDEPALREAAQCQVVGLGAAARERHLIRPDADALGNLHPRPLQQPLRLPAGAVHR